MEVVAKATGKISWFPCGRWLSTKHDDGIMERTLVAANQNPEKLREDYVLEIWTSDIRGASTDANVHVKLEGSAGSSELKKLRAPLEAFERGLKDKFTLKGLPVRYTVAIPFCLCSWLDVRM